MVAWAEYVTQTPSGALECSSPQVLTVGVVGATTGHRTTRFPYRDETLWRRLGLMEKLLSLARHPKVMRLVVEQTRLVPATRAPSLDRRLHSPGQCPSGKDSHGGCWRQEPSRSATTYEGYRAGSAIVGPITPHYCPRPQLGHSEGRKSSAGQRGACRADEAGRQPPTWPGCVHRTLGPQVMVEPKGKQANKQPDERDGATWGTKQSLRGHSDIPSGPAQRNECCEGRYQKQAGRARRRLRQSPGQCEAVHRGYGQRGLAPRVPTALWRCLALWP